MDWLKQRWTDLCNWWAGTPTPVAAPPKEEQPGPKLSVYAMDLGELLGLGRKKSSPSESIDFAKECVNDVRKVAVEKTPQYVAELDAVMEKLDTAKRLVDEAYDGYVAVCDKPELKKEEIDEEADDTEVTQQPADEGNKSA